MCKPATACSFGLFVLFVSFPGVVKLLHSVGVHECESEFLILFGFHFHLFAENLFYSA